MAVCSLAGLGGILGSNGKTAILLRSTRDPPYLRHPSSDFGPLEPLYKEESAEFHGRPLTTAILP